MKKTKRTGRVTINLEPNEKSYLEAVAELNGDSLSNLLTRLTRQAFGTQQDHIKNVEFEPEEWREMLAPQFKPINFGETVKRVGNFIHAFVLALV